ncbi:hypothetical protein CEXT_238171 [Caerostris extrusa]|uniref:Uncharacterized protein n=1 Tax=Caerostris extrusa TaxID=172846 RepID=A0AAV4RLP3_CAEEX|nr:hypothetical protein CEXT_238171 [Caerostris extrusa]
MVNNGKYFIVEETHAFSDNDAFSSTIKIKKLALYVRETLCLLLMWKYNLFPKDILQKKTLDVEQNTIISRRKFQHGRSIQLFSSFVHGKSAIHVATGEKRKFLQKGRKISNISTQKCPSPSNKGKEKKQAADFPTFPPTISASAEERREAKEGNRFARILFCSQRNGFSATLSEFQDICPRRTNLSPE